MGARKQGQPEPVRVRAVRIGSSQLHRHEIRHGGTEDRPVHRPQPSEIRSGQGNAGNSVGKNAVPRLRIWSFICSDESQEKLEFGSGFASIAQAVSVVVGAEKRWIPPAQFRFLIFFVSSTLVITIGYLLFYEIYKGRTVKCQQ